MWHQTDVSLLVPKAHVYLHLATPLSYLSSHHDHLCCQLYCKLVDNLLEPSVYFAELAGTSYGLACSDDGIVLHFSCFSSVVKKLVDLVLAGMRDLSFTSERFDTVKGRLIQQWKVWQKNNPLSHCDYYCDHLLKDPSFLVKDSLHLLEAGSIGPDQIMDWSVRLFRGPMEIQMLCYGNLEEGESRSLGTLVRSRLKPQGLAPLPRPSILQLPPAGPLNGGSFLVYRPENPNPSNSNSAIILMSEIGVGEKHPATSVEDVRISVLASLLVKVASRPCFHTLRTVERLGYTVQLTLDKVDGVLYVKIKIQSPDKDTEVLRDRAMTWLDDYRSELADLSPDRFEAFKASLLEHYLEPPRSLAAAAARAWGPIRNLTYDWQARQLKAECIKGTLHQELLDFYDGYIRPPQPTPTNSEAAAAARLCIEIQSGKASKDRGVDQRGAKRQKTSSSVIESDEEVREFKRGLSRFKC